MLWRFRQHCSPPSTELFVDVAGLRLTGYWSGRDFKLRHLFATEGVASMTEAELRAEITTTRQRRQAADARIQGLNVEIEQAEKRQELRRDLEEEMEELEQREKAIRDKAARRLHIDADRAGNTRTRAHNGVSTSFALDVLRGEYEWELRQSA